MQRTFLEYLDFFFTLPHTPSPTPSPQTALQLRYACEDGKNSSGNGLRRLMTNGILTNGKGIPSQSHLGFIPPPHPIPLCSPPLSSILRRRGGFVCTLGKQSCWERGGGGGWGANGVTHLRITEHHCHWPISNWKKNTLCPLDTYVNSNSVSRKQKE